MKPEPDHLLGAAAVLAVIGATLIWLPLGLLTAAVVLGAVAILWETARADRDTGPE